MTNAELRYYQDVGVIRQAVSSIASSLLRIANSMGPPPGAEVVGTRVADDDNYEKGEVEKAKVDHACARCAASIPPTGYCTWKCAERNGHKEP